MKKLLILIVALASLFCLSLTVSAVCSEDVDLGTFDMVEKYYGDTVVKDADGNIIGGYNPGGNNNFSAIFDGTTTSTGWGGGPAPREWNDNFNITLFYADSYLIEELTIYYVTWGANYGYLIEISNDGGKTWQEVGAYTVPEDFTEDTVVSTTFSIADGNGMMGNAIRFRWLNGYKGFNVTFNEIDIAGKKILDCKWDEGKVTTEATCGADGVLTYTCSECQGTREEVIDATGEHNWDNGTITVTPSEESSGLKVYSCTVCDETKEEFLHATGHNWDSGVIINPTCTEQGYTKYTCTDAGCGKTYNGSFVDALGHSYDDGVETKHPTLTAEGEKTFSCVIDGCDEFYTEVLPMAKLDDSSFVIGADNIFSFEENISNGLDHENRDYNKLFDGNKTNSTNSQSNPNGWFAPNGSTLTIVFDEEYYIIGFDYYVWSNYNSATFECFDGNGQKVVHFQKNDIQQTGGLPLTLADAIGKNIKTIKITINNAKGSADYGNCLDFQEFVITAHKHLAEGDTARYDEVSDCTVGGSYKKYCYVCEKEVNVQFKSSGEHSLSGEIIFENGYDRAGKAITSCANCTATETVRIPALFYSYGYSVREFGGAAITHKVEINKEALETYNSLSSTPLVYGMVAAATPNFEGSPLVVNDGKVEKANSKVVLKDFSTTEYVCFEYTIANIAQSAYDTELVICPFIFNGTSVSYINVNENSGESFETVTLNSLK